MRPGVGCMEMMMRKKPYTAIVCIVLCAGAVAFCETSRRSWTVHTWLSVVSHGHLIHRVVHISQLHGEIPSHYPVHSMESQRLVFRGSTYLGYLS